MAFQCSQCPASEHRFVLRHFPHTWACCLSNALQTFADFRGNLLLSVGRIDLQTCLSCAMCTHRTQSSTVSLHSTICISIRLRSSTLSDKTSFLTVSGLHRRQSPKCTEMRGSASLSLIAAPHSACSYPTSPDVAVGPSTSRDARGRLRRRSGQSPTSSTGGTAPATPPS